MADDSSNVFSPEYETNRSTSLDGTHPFESVQTFSETAIDELFHHMGCDHSILDSNDPV